MRPFLLVLLVISVTCLMADGLSETLSKEDRDTNRKEKRFLRIGREEGSSEEDENVSEEKRFLRIGREEGNGSSSEDENVSEEKRFLRIGREEGSSSEDEKGLRRKTIHAFWP
ncbi:hypothetical protein ACOMHN_034397 [Nucella lapillus]